MDDKNIGFALGATDYLTKPIDRSRLAAAADATAAGEDGCRVLLVEDDEATREMMRALLTREGWMVTEAANGRVALERLAAAGPDLILLDLMMPEMDGFEFAQRLRERPEWQCSPGHRADGQRHHRRGPAAAERLCGEDRCKRAPGDHEALLREVRELVDRPQGTEERRCLRSCWWKTTKTTGTCSPAACIRKGYEVVAGGGRRRRACRQAAAESPDLILMDMSLPVLDGWEATPPHQGRRRRRGTSPSSR